MSEIRKPDEFGCTLVIETGEEHPDVVTSMVDIQPSELVVKGSQKLTKSGKAIVDSFNDRNLWILKMDKQYGNFDTHLNSAIELMIDTLDSNEDAFLNVLSKYGQNHLSCYAYFYDYNPYFSLKKTLSKRLSKYSIDIEFDIYYLIE
jgi:hypothetical protein